MVCYTDSHDSFSYYDDESWSCSNLRNRNSVGEQQTISGQSFISDLQFVREYDDALSAMNDKS